MMLHIPRGNRDSTRRTEVTPYKYKRPSTVLEEDSYHSSLEEIIARDYFPAVKTIQEKIDQLDGDTKDQVMKDVSTLTVSEFQEKYTTEDNASFGQIIEKEIIKKRKKRDSMKAIEGNKARVTKQLEAKKQERLLKDESFAEDQRNLQKRGLEDKRPSTLNSWSHREQNTLMFPVDTHYGTPSKNGTVTPTNTRLATEPSSGEEANRQMVISALNRKSSDFSFSGYDLVSKNGYTMPNASKNDKLLDSMLDERKHIKQKEQGRTTHVGTSSNLPSSSRRTQVLTPAASRLVKNSAGLYTKNGFSFNVTPRRTSK